jgi:fucose 4-O-acetylase-like acetyltransferase
MNMNTLKGILIILVILDHNDFVRSIFPRFLDGFSFHVLGFMALPFLRPAQPLDRDFLQYLFRLYHPFLVITTAMALVVALLGQAGPALQFERWALALYSGNSDILKQVTHMALLWFLPSFVSMVALRGVIEHAGQGGKAAAIALLCVLHLFIGTVAHRIDNYLPLGLLPALYVIPLAYLAVAIHRRVFARMPRGAALAASCALLAAAKYAQMRMGLHNEIGFGDVADYTQPYALALNDLEAVTGVVMLFQASRFGFGRLVETCGRYSIQVYLFHAYVALGVTTAVLKLTPGAGPVAHFAISFAITVPVSAAVARFMAGQKLVKRLMFPRTTGELFGTGPARPVALATTEAPNRNGAQ